MRRGDLEKKKKHLKTKIQKAHEKRGLAGKNTTKPRPSLLLLPSTLYHLLSSNKEFRKSYSVRLSR
jgi:hypothetical protein